MPLLVMLSSLRGVSTKREAALVSSQGWTAWQDEGGVSRSVIASQKPASIVGRGTGARYRLAFIVTVPSVSSTGSNPCRS